LIFVLAALLVTIVRAAIKTPTANSTMNSRDYDEGGLAAKSPQASHQRHA
jgi:hypothetical protein